jgi:hypothetical protein
MIVERWQVFVMTKTLSALTMRTPRLLASFTELPAGVANQLALVHYCPPVTVCGGEDDHLLRPIHVELENAVLGLTP